MTRQQYVIQVDTTHSFVGMLPRNLIAVMGYDTGTPDIDWTDADWMRFPLASHVIVDQSYSLPKYEAGLANIADVENGAATIGSFIPASLQRLSRGHDANLYISYDKLGTALADCHEAGIRSPRVFVANYNWSMHDAINYLETHSFAVGVQFADPGQNPRTIVPGTGMTLKEANADLSVKRADWFPAPAPAAIAWDE